MVTSEKLITAQLCGSAHATLHVREPLIISVSVSSFINNSFYVGNVALQKKKAKSCCPLARPVSESYTTSRFGALNLCEEFVLKRPKMWIKTC